MKQNQHRSSARVLVVEDEAAIVTLLRYNLEARGYEVAVAMDGDEAISEALSHPPDIILLDWMLPNRSGLSVCKTLRKHPVLSACPIIMVTARGDAPDVEKGLRAGVDAYVKKPFDIEELLAQIQAYLQPIQPADHTLYVDDVHLDLHQGVAFRGARALELSSQERQLLQAMLDRPGRIFEREELMQILIDGAEQGMKLKLQASDKAAMQRKVDSLMRSLRKALTSAGEDDLIRPIRGVGYALESQQFSP